MRLSFFSKKNTTKNQSETQTEKLQTSLSAEIEKNLPQSLDMLQINYVFLCTEGRKGDHFASKLAEAGDEISYRKIVGKGYVITGTTERIKADADIAKQRIIEMTEHGLKYGCSLAEWNFIAC